MTKDFDIVNEQKISTENVVENEFVNVGWGSYETQFKGSVGKNASKEKVTNFNTIEQFLSFSRLKIKFCHGTMGSRKFAGDLMANIL